MATSSLRLEAISILPYVNMGACFGKSLPEIDISMQATRARRLSVLLTESELDELEKRHASLDVDQIH